MDGRKGMQVSPGEGNGMCETLYWNHTASRGAYLRVRYEIKENQIIQGPVRTKRLGHEGLNIF